MKQLNNHGSILQIVLVVFIIMTFALTSSLYLIQEQTRLYKKIDQLLQQKNLEILLVEYYAKQVKNSNVWSEYYEGDGYIVQSYVDDMGNFYEITTRVQSQNMNYEFIVQVELETAQVLKFEYVEE